MSTISAASSTTDAVHPSMHPVSQIVERNLGRHSACDYALWMNPEPDGGWLKVKAACPSLKLFSQDHGSFTFLQQSGAEIEFAAFPQVPEHRYRWIILNLPRQKSLLRLLLRCAADLLTDDGVLWLAGENKAGIKSANKVLKEYFGQVRKLDNARHCTLFEAGNALSPQPFSPLDYRHQWVLCCGHSEVRVSSYPGVFAHGRLDAGTALLLEALSAVNISGDVLDFACGAGLIGACIASKHPHASVTLLDSNALALQACRETLDANQLQGAVVASNGLAEISSSFDFVVSNPPIHIGIKTDNQLSQRLLDNVLDHINPDGMLIVVANIHLPYENWLSQRFTRCNQLTANAHYKVLAAIR